VFDLFFAQLNRDPLQPARNDDLSQWQPPGCTNLFRLTHPVLERLDQIMSTPLPLAVATDGPCRLECRRDDDVAIRNPALVEVWRPA
jgi:hypothetical protein